MVMKKKLVILEEKSYCDIMRNPQVYRIETKGKKASYLFFLICWLNFLSPCRTDIENLLQKWSIAIFSRDFIAHTK